jgi:hypothetical protein
MSMLMLDAAFPPAPAELLQDLDQVGARAAAVYVWGGASRGWTPAHVSALRQGGKYALPVVVPGNAPPADVGPILDALLAFGFAAGPVATDYETGSEPPAAWTWQWDTQLGAHGYRYVDYGTRDELGRHPAPGEWLASWLRTGVLAPLPVLPPGLLAWQFVDDVQLAHGLYDVSVVDDVELFGGDMTGPLSDPTAQQSLIDAVTRILTLLADGKQATADPATGQLKPVPADWPNWLPDALVSGLAGLQAHIQAPPAVDVGALAAALVAAPGFADAIAAAVTHRLGAALAQG